MGSRLENAVRFCVSMISGRATAPPEGRGPGDRRQTTLPFSDNLNSPRTPTLTLPCHSACSLVPIRANWLRSVNRGLRSGIYPHSSTAIKNPQGTRPEERHDRPVRLARKTHRFLLIPRLRSRFPTVLSKTPHRWANLPFQPFSGMMN